MMTSSYKQLFSLLLLILVITSCTGDQPPGVESPDGELRAEVWLNGEGSPLYSITTSGEEVIEASELGIIRDDADFSSGLTLVDAGESEEIRDSYEMKQGKSRVRHGVANQRRYTFEHPSGEQIQLLFRVSDDGVAFRYHFPDSSDSHRSVTDERTSFTFPGQTEAWLTPMAVVNTGWSETNPSYEEYYEVGIEAGRESPLGVGWSYPALFRTPGDHWALVTESGMDGTYPGTRLVPGPEHGYKVGFPAGEEVTTGGIRGPEFETPWTSPWRVIAIGGLDTIVESTLGTDVASSSDYENTDYIESGRASWSWAKLKDASVNFDTQIQFIDYAADMGWEYTLVDVNWDQTIGYDRIGELAEYAGEKGVGLWLWYNSSGDWNTSPYTPKSRLLTSEDRREEFERISDMGIRGIKVDFFPGDGQSALQYYIDLLEDAHDFGLMVNTHGSTIPRGWHRTWPNLMTMESVKGFEFKTFEQENANQAAQHATILPFTRNAFDPMDFTPMSLDSIPGIDRVTTTSHELALPVLFLSGVQHLAETPDGMATVPDFVQDFVKSVPAAWDETRFVDGFPGEDVIIARRIGDSWFVGGINGEEVEKQVTVDLPFLTEMRDGLLISDGEDPYSFKQDSIEIGDETSIDVTMAPNGGFVIHLE